MNTFSPVILQDFETEQVSGGGVVVPIVVGAIVGVGLIAGFINGYGDESNKAKGKDVKPTK